MYFVFFFHFSFVLARCVCFFCPMVRTVKTRYLETPVISNLGRFPVSL